MNTTRKDYKKWIEIDIEGYLKKKNNKKESTQDIDIGKCLKNTNKKWKYTEKDTEKIDIKVCLKKREKIWKSTWKNTLKNT